jgi:hypothetical protein
VCTGLAFQISKRSSASHRNLNYHQHAVQVRNTTRYERWDVASTDSLSHFTPMEAKRGGSSQKPVEPPKRSASKSRSASSAGSGQDISASTVKRVLVNPPSLRVLRRKTPLSTVDGAPPNAPVIRLTLQDVGLSSGLEHPDLLRLPPWSAVPLVWEPSSAEPYTFLATSPFRNRASTIIVRPLDASTSAQSTLVVPIAMQPESTSDAVAETLRAPIALPQAGQGLPPSGFARVKRVGRKGKYAGVLVCMPDRAVRFSSIMAMFNATGMTETNDLEDPNWVLRWAKRVEIEQYGAMLAYQKINHFPGTWGVGRKDNLHRRMTALAKKHGKELYSFVPAGFVLPKDRRVLELDYQHRLQELKKRREEARRSGGAAAAALVRKRPLYIRKQVASACGRGMRVISRVPTRDVKSLIQEYVDDPLLIGGKKFDLRIYVLVTSYNPLRVYVYREGLARFASSPYPVGEAANASCKTAHLTNYSVNKHNLAGFKQPVLQPSQEASAGDVCNAPIEEADDDGEEDDDDIPETSGAIGEGAADSSDVDDSDDAGSKWTFTMLRHHFESQGWDWDALWAGIDDVIIKTLLAVEPDVAELVNKLYTNPMPGCDGAGNNFELYGFDILPCEGLRLSLMEVNIMPSLETNGSDLDQHVKANMLAELLTLVGIQAVGQKPSKVTATGDEFIDSLPAEQAAIIKASEEEFLRRGHFRRIFPTISGWDTYKRFFTEPRPLNAILAQWELRKAAGLATVALNDKFIGKQFVFDGSGKPEAKDTTQDAVEDM